MMKAQDGSGNLTERIRELERELEELRTYGEKQLAETRAKYTSLMNSTSEGYLELDLALRITNCNTTILDLLNREKQELLGKVLDTFYNKNSVFVHFASKNHLSFEADFETAGGETIPLFCKRSIIQDSEGRPSGYLVLLTDLTELKKVQESLKKAQARYRNMYENAVQGMYQCTLEGKFLNVNPALAHTFGFATTNELLAYPGGAASLYKNPEDRKNLLSLLRENKVIRNYEAEMVGPGGKTVWGLINNRLAEDERGNIIIEGIMIDNTEKKMAEEKLRLSRERFRYLAIHDNLTGLYNTRYLYKELDKLVAQSRAGNRAFSLVFLDMDNFKRVVDTHGHLNGSQVLKEVAKTLQDNLEEPAFGVAYGGDEFVLVLPETDKEEALQRVRAVRAKMKKTTYLENKGLAVNISASFGIATFPEDAQDRDSLLALADEALFRIKSCGKDAIGVTN